MAYLHMRMRSCLIYVTFLGMQANSHSISTGNGSNLNYELFGNVLSANGHWELVTWVDFTYYNVMYKYLLSKADKLQVFCTSASTLSCKNGCERLQYELAGINEGHDSLEKLIGVSKPRVKRFWNEAADHLSKIGKLPVESNIQMSAKNPAPMNIATYNKELDEFENTLNEVENHPDQRRTFFRLEKMWQWLNKTMKSFQGDEGGILTPQEMNSLLDDRGRKEYLVFAVDMLENEFKDFSSYKSRKHFKKSYNSVFKCDFEFFGLLIYILSTFKDEQTKLIEATGDANKGELNSYILSPPILVLLLKYIQFNVPEGLSFPFYAISENHKKLHSITKPSVYMYNNKIIFNLQIPLVESDPYKIYKLKNFTKSSFIQEYDSQAPYLVVDRRFSEYQLRSVDSFKNFCKKIDTNKFLCKEIQRTQVAEYTIKKMEKGTKMDTHEAGLYYGVGGGTVAFIVCIFSYFTYTKMCKEKPTKKIDSKLKQKEKFQIKFTVKKDDTNIRKLVLNNFPNIEYNARRQQNEIRSEFCQRNHFNSEESELESNLYESPRTSSSQENSRIYSSR